MAAACREVAGRPTTGLGGMGEPDAVGKGGGCGPHERDTRLAVRGGHVGRKDGSETGLGKHAAGEG